MQSARSQRCLYDIDDGEDTELEIEIVAGD